MSPASLQLGVAAGLDLASETTVCWVFLGKVCSPDVKDGPGSSRPPPSPHPLTGEPARKNEEETPRASGFLHLSWLSHYSWTNCDAGNTNPDFFESLWMYSMLHPSQCIPSGSHGPGFPAVNGSEGETQCTLTVAPVV